MVQVFCGGCSNSQNFMRLGCAFSGGDAAFDQENQESGEFSQIRSGFAEITVTWGLAEGLARHSAARIAGIGTFVEDTQIG